MDDAFDNAIALVHSDEEFSCTALKRARATQSEVNKYRRMFGYKRCLWSEVDYFLSDVYDFAGSYDSLRAINFRTLLLGFAKVAWGDFK